MTSISGEVNWQPPTDAHVHIVCAACKKNGFIVTSPRHFDSIMRSQMEVYHQANDFDSSYHVGWKEGFVDQFCRFYSREEAMQVVEGFKQPWNLGRNGGSNEKLYSEGLY